METWTNIISTVGFPIACVIALGFFVYTFYKDYTKQSAEREEKLYEALAISHTNNEKLVEANKGFVSVLETYKNDITEIKHDIVEIKHIVEKENA